MAFASAQQIDDRLLVRFSTDQLENMKKTQPDELDLLSYALDHALYISDAPEGKNHDLSEISNIEEKNFLELGLEIKDTNQYFRITGTNNVLVVKSRWVLNHEMNK
jgi:hypothetical protein